MKTVGPYLLLAFLFAASAWVWFQSQKFIGAAGKEKVNSEMQTLKDKVSEARMIQIPVVVEEAALPKKVEVKKAVMPKKEAANKVDKHNSGGNNKAGTSPNIFAGYGMSVKEYLLYMKYRGGRVFVYDKVKDGFICEILEEDVFGTPSDISKMSRRSRRLTADFPRSNEVLSKVEEHFGIGNYEILLLLPSRLEKSIYENITRIVSEKGLRMEDIETVFISYRGNDSFVSVYIEKVTGNFGMRMIGETFKL